MVSVSDFMEDSAKHCLRWNVVHATSPVIVCCSYIAAGQDDFCLWWRGTGDCMVTPYMTYACSIVHSLGSAENQRFRHESRNTDEWVYFCRWSSEFDNILDCRVLKIASGCIKCISLYIHWKQVTCLHLTVTPCNTYTREQSFCVCTSKWIMHYVTNS